MSAEFEINDFVWAKLRGNPYWPGIVIEPLNNAPPKPRRGVTFLVFFFGSQDYSWVQQRFIKPYEPNMEKYLSDLVRTAYEELEFHRDMLRTDPEYKIEFPEVRMDTPNRKRARSPDTESVSSRTRLRSSSVNSSSTRASSRTSRPGSSQSTSSVASTTRSRRRRRAGNHDSDSVSSGKSGRNSSGNSSSRRTSSRAGTKNGSDDEYDNIHTYSGYVGVLACNIYASPIIQKLILAKHNVAIWSTSEHLCADLQDYANETSQITNGEFRVYKNIWEVVAISDIVFSCFSTANESKDTFVKLCKHNAFPSHKLYIETTNIGHEQSYEMERILAARNAYYMEAMINGTPENINERRCIILLAGSETAWNLIEKNFMSCFWSLTDEKSSIRMVGDIGTAVKVQSILYMMKATWIAGLHEILGLIDKIVERKKDGKMALPKILQANRNEIHPLRSDSIMQTCSTIDNNKYLDIKESIPILQENLQRMLNVSDMYQEPLVLVSTANQIFKLARRAGYDNLDASILFNIFK